MALFSDYGNATSDPGVPFTFGVDPETGKEVKLVIRSLPLDIEESIRRKYLRRSRRTRELQFDVRNTLSYLQDRVSWMWVDAINFVVSISDEGAAEFYRAELKAVTSPGDAILLDGRLTTAIKRRIISRMPQLAEFIVEKSVEMREGEREEDDELGKE